MNINRLRREVSAIIKASEQRGCVHPPPHHNRGD